MLRTKTTCTFSTSTLPKLFQTWCAFNALTSKCASRTTFGCWSGIFGGARHGFSTFTQIELNNGRRGTFEKDPQTCISHGRRSTRDISTRHVRRSGRWFPQRGCILEQQIFRFAKTILCDRCSTSYDLAWLFVAGAILSRHGIDKITITYWYEAVSINKDRQIDRLIR